MWPYEVIDNYLDDKTFNKLNNEIKDVIPEDGKIYRKWLDYDPTPQIETLVKNYRVRRHYGPYKKFIHFAVTPAGFVHPEHDEAEFKIMSAIIYLSPEKNKGTTLVDYTKVPSHGGNPEKITVDWKQNRLMNFCGLTDNTWHYYESTDVRYTYNYFLVDPDKIQNEEYKKYCID